MHSRRPCHFKPVRQPVQGTQGSDGGVRGFAFGRVAVRSVHDASTELDFAFVDGDQPADASTWQ